MASAALRRRSATTAATRQRRRPTAPRTYSTAMGPSRTAEPVLGREPGANPSTLRGLSPGVRITLRRFPLGRSHSSRRRFASATRQTSGRLSRTRTTRVGDGTPRRISTPGRMQQAAAFVSPRARPAWKRGPAQAWSRAEGWTQKGKVEGWTFPETPAPGKRPTCSQARWP